MISYCLECKKNNKSINPKVIKTKNGRTTILSQCDVCGSKKSRLIKKQEARGLLILLGFKTGLNKMPFFRDHLL